MSSGPAFFRERRGRWEIYHREARQPLGNEDETASVARHPLASRKTKNMKSISLVLCLGLAIATAGCGHEGAQLDSTSSALIGSGYGTATCTIGKVVRACSTFSCTLSPCDSAFERMCKAEGGRLEVLYDPGSATATYHECNSAVACGTLVVSGDCVRAGEEFICDKPGDWGCVSGHCGTPPSGS